MMKYTVSKLFQHLCCLHVCKLHHMMPHMPCFLKRGFCLHPLVLPYVAVLARFPARKPISKFHPHRWRRAQTMQLTDSAKVKEHDHGFLHPCPPLPQTPGLDLDLQSSIRRLKMPKNDKKMLENKPKGNICGQSVWCRAGPVLDSRCFAYQRPQLWSKSH